MKFAKFMEIQYYAYICFPKHSYLFHSLYIEFVMENIDRQLSINTWDFIYICGSYYYCSSRIYCIALVVARHCVEHMFWQREFDPVQVFFCEETCILENGFQGLCLSVIIGFVFPIFIGFISYITLCFKFLWVFGGLCYMSSKSFKFL